MNDDKYIPVEEEAYTRPEVVAKIMSELGECRERFVQGDRAALFQTLAICALNQAVIPEWAADAILQGDDDLKTGAKQDFNELFGWRPTDKRVRRMSSRLRSIAPDVLLALMKHRAEGGNLNQDEAFSAVASEVGVSWRDVKAIYKANKDKLTTIGQGNPSGGSFGTLKLTIPIPRRYGRSIL